MIPAEARKSAVFGPASGTVAGMATRTSSAPRGNSSGKSGSSSARGSGPAASKTSKPSGTTGTARTRQMAAVEPRQPWLVRVVAGAWLGVAHVVGAGIRRIGYDVSDLAPEDRRDGAALFNLALGVFVATFAWWGFQGWFPDMVYGIVNGTFGWMALLLPLMLFVCAFRLFRQPVDGRGNNRIGIGFLIMTVRRLRPRPRHWRGTDRRRRIRRTAPRRRHARLPCRGPAGRHPLRRPGGRLRPAGLHLPADRHRHAVRRHPRPAARRLRAPHGHRPAGPDADGGDGHDRSYLYENDAPAPAKKKRRRLFGKDHERRRRTRRLRRGRGLRAGTHCRRGSRGRPGRRRRQDRLQVRRTRRAPSHPGRDRRREDQGRPGARERRRQVRPGRTPPRRSRSSPPGWSPPVR